MFTEEIQDKMLHWRKLCTVFSKNNMEATIFIELEDEENLTLAYEIVTPENIVNKIKDRKINLDYCYLCNLKYCDIVEHLKDIKEISAVGTFFDGILDFTDAKFNKIKINFNGAQFSDEGASFRKMRFTEGELDFANAQFGNGIVSFSDAIVESSIMRFHSVKCGKGKVFFSGVQFSGREFDFSNIQLETEVISFAGAKFNGEEVNFSGTKFGKGNVSFNMTDFGDSRVLFEETDFGDGDINFRRSKFGRGTVTFWMSRFGKSTVRFCHAEFQSKSMNFQDMNFGEAEVDFEDVNFGDGDLAFANSEAEKSCMIFERCKLLGHENLRFKSVHKLEIIDCIIDGTLLINSKDECDVRIDKLSLADTKNIGAIFINGEVAIQAVSHYENCSYISKANQMKMLKENFHNIGEYDWEDESYVEYKRYRRKNLWEQRKSECCILKKLKLLVEIILDYLIDWIGVYATSPTRVALCMFIVWLIFGTAFGMGTYMDCLELNTSSTMQFIEGYYFSAITFLTIGYGDISPLGWFAKVLAPAEGFLGLFLMSYFTVAVVRKTLR